ncbi:hypothetical protein HMPREF1548_04845 [Clostridium sp. KLE 1755]|nr:hypothetical protein HMPREF1548_04845 [Clostridium sp. KLE 1755]
MTFFLTDFIKILLFPYYILSSGIRTFRCFSSSKNMPVRLFFKPWGIFHTR